MPRGWVLDLALIREQCGLEFGCRFIGIMKGFKPWLAPRNAMRGSLGALPLAASDVPFTLECVLDVRKCRARVWGKGVGA